MRFCPFLNSLKKVLQFQQMLMFLNMPVNRMIAFNKIDAKINMLHAKFKKEEEVGKINTGGKVSSMTI